VPALHWAIYSCALKTTFDTIITMSSPTKLCLLDLVATDMLNELVDILLLYLMAMVNASLRASYLPASQKTATLWRASVSCCHSAVEEVITRRYRAQEPRRPICRLSRRRSIALLLSTLFRTYDWMTSDLLSHFHHCWKISWYFRKYQRYRKYTLLKYKICYQIVVCVCALHIRWCTLVIHTA